MPLTGPIGIPPNRIGWLDMVIGRDGSVELRQAAHPSQSSPRAHDRQSRQGVAYRPATKGGRPVRIGYWSRSICRNRGSWFGVRSSRFGVRGSRFEVRGSRFEVRGSRFEVRGSRFEVRGSRFEVRGSWFEVRGSGFGVRGSGFLVRGSKLRVRIGGFASGALYGCNARQPGTRNPEPRTTNYELRTTNHEPRTTNHEPKPAPPCHADQVMAGVKHHEDLEAWQLSENLRQAIVALLATTVGSQASRILRSDRTFQPIRAGEHRRRFFPLQAARLRALHAHRPRLPGRNPKPSPRCPERQDDLAGRVRQRVGTLP